MSPRPGFVLEVDRSTPPTLFWHGERFSLERLPEGSRVVYAPEPLEPLSDPVAAIRHALAHPLGDREPAAGAAAPGHEADHRLRRHLAAPAAHGARPTSARWSSSRSSTWRPTAGVDDVVLIAALALHRRMTEAELRHALGDRIYDAFAPHGLLTQHDAEDPDNLVHLGPTDQGEDVEINKRAADSDLLVYVNINLVAMDGGHKSVATGLASYRSLRHHHNPPTMQHSRSFMDQHRSELHSSNWRMGRLIADSGVKVFQIETTLNTDTFPPHVRLPAEARVGVGAARPGRLGACLVAGPGPHPGPAGPPDLPLGAGRPTRMTSVQAGEVEAVHAVTTDNVWAQQGVAVEGQTDILTMGLPYICPYNVNSIMNPILVACLGLGLLLQPLPGQAAGARGRRADPAPPHPVGVPPGAPPELHRLLRAGAHRDHRPGRDGQAATRSPSPPTRGTSTSTAPATPTTASIPFYMWYWCAHALAAPGPGDRRRRRPGGGAPARLLAGLHPRRRPRDGRGRGRARRPRLTHLHAPPHPDGGRPVSARPDRPGERPRSARGHGRSPASRWRAPRPWPRPGVAPRRLPSAGLGRRLRHTTGRAATRCAWPGPCVLDNVTRPLARLVAPTTGARRRAPPPRRRRRSSSPPTTPATSTPRCC